MAARGLILDFGGVLTTSMIDNRTRFETVEHLAADSYRRALTEHPEGLHVYSELEVGRATQSDWNTVIGGILGIDPHDLMRRALAGLKPVPEMIDTVKALRAQGVATALLSNSFGLEPYDIYAEHGIYDLVDVVVLSETEGFRKPDSLIYQRTLELMGLPGEDCVFVDDHLLNLPPAEALGITTIHHTDPAATIARLNELFDESASPAVSPVLGSGLS